MVRLHFFTSEHHRIVFVIHLLQRSRRFFVTRLGSHCRELRQVRRKRLHAQQGKISVLVQPSCVRPTVVIHITDTRAIFFSRQQRGAQRQQACTLPQERLQPTCPSLQYGPGKRRQRWTLYGRVKGKHLHGKLCELSGHLCTRVVDLGVSSY